MGTWRIAVLLKQIDTFKIKLKPKPFFWLRYTRHWRNYHHWSPCGCYGLGPSMKAHPLATVTSKNRHWQRKPSTTHFSAVMNDDLCKCRVGMCGGLPLLASVFTSGSSKWISCYSETHIDGDLDTVSLRSKSHFWGILHCITLMYIRYSTPSFPCAML